MTDYAKWRSRPERVVKLFAVNRRKAETIVEKHMRQRTYEIGEVESKEILESYGFAVPRAAVATTAEQAANIAQQLGFPVVVKIWSPEVIHKTDVGGVRLNLSTTEEVMDAFDLITYRIARKLPNANVLGVVVQQMIVTGREVILGMNRDPHCGPLMMFGMGGVMVEVLRDVSFYLAPLTPEEATQMLMSTKTYQMLRGVRGEPGVDIEAIAEGLQRLSQLVTEFPQIEQIDINPYVVGPKGTTPVAVDARIVLVSP
jgi:acetyltransferase